MELTSFRGKRWKETVDIMRLTFTWKYDDIWHGVHFIHRTRRRSSDGHDLVLRRQSLENYIKSRTKKPFEHPPGELSDFGRSRQDLSEISGAPCPVPKHRLIWESTHNIAPREFFHTVDLAGTQHSILICNADKIPTLWHRYAGAVFHGSENR